ncbi:hypothetical protein [Virgibacillus pantothenticus]|uniref:hypothetical protein n=1 Tax=Virgibacillus pantothenticus TaxID=1473 RepID=UPI00098544B8|nr:hypothetical protein [Virgibacillus pantothenticus]
MFKDTFIIAGKEEGFRYEDARIVVLHDISMHGDGKEIVENHINKLRVGGYKIFYITETVDRIDDIADAANGVNP